MTQPWYIATIILKCEVAGQPAIQKEALSVFYIDKIRYLTAEEILENGIETRLILNRVRI